MIKRIIGLVANTIRATIVSAFLVLSLVLVPAAFLLGRATA
ncbi:MAG: hypothetical protein JWO42_87 [Chloroflexi bacterium]|jgi:hypothetical protein|nr:hypothetical protein [Chloroflexota bacterium]